MIAIAIARKNLFCLYLNTNSFLCNSNLHLFPAFQFFSTSKVERQIPSPKIYDVLVNKHHFSPESASLAASRSPKSRSPKIADSVLSFFKENSFTTTQLEKIVIFYPAILGSRIERIRFKFKVFQDLGLSPEEIANIISKDICILKSSTKNRIIPSISKLQDVLEPGHDVVRLLKRFAWFLRADLEKSLMPNVEILKSCGIPMERIQHFLFLQPKCFLVKPHIMRKSVDKAIEIGASKASINFIFCVCLFALKSKRMWEVKLQTLRDLGFSDNDMFVILRKQPTVFSTSGNKIKNVIELLVATGKYDMSSIVTCPSALGCSIEKRLEPRLQILWLLESLIMMRLAKNTSLGDTCGGPKALKL
ncbi:uncharacterized protein LOC130994121 [Salvia miltiorrhiza]|uniref:uncharacterized protein LOC130994121 n=1 Tax=Salvia miltiorrhiza TaxID=226208 RepID=UPI0025ACA2EF|nr:uncharacterized protein LOC130994121 [Salvia miltiorrhiza]